MVIFSVDRAGSQLISSLVVWDTGCIRKGLHTTQPWSELGVGCWVEAAGRLGGRWNRHVRHRFLLVVRGGSRARDASSGTSISAAAKMTSSDFNTANGL